MHVQASASTEAGGMLQTIHLPFIASLCPRLAMGAGEDIDTTCTPYLLRWAQGAQGPRAQGPRARAPAICSGSGGGGGGKT